MNSLYASLCYPHPYRGWPTAGNRMSSRNVCMPQCSSPNLGPSTSRANSTYKGDSHRSSATFNNPRALFPIPSQIFPFPPRAMLHPALWNPWLLWPGAFCFPPAASNLEELQKNWMRFWQPQHPELDKLRSNPTMEGKADTISQQTSVRDSDDDGDFPPLVIDVERHSDCEQRRS
ncbi:HMG box domain-containing protein [Nephila pilipes]|uniref:HMG box domain-containing protein n=1 Tax=Nephila pilipes TaxID=299642 RepID=A0A8X6QSD3_NEPPI|nr:HMG box domain-containing protein [Nephila pilipes]